MFKDWGGRIPIALIYPNSYYLGMSNLGFQTIYGLLNSYENIVCERFFCDRSKASLLSLESQRPLDDFAVLAFSISYELDYFNVVQVLKASGTPLLAAERDHRHPLVIAGGPCIIANPEPLAPFFDCFVIGEGEAILPPMLEILSEAIQGSRDDLLKGLAEVPGVYLPNDHQAKPIARRWLRDLDDFATASVVLTPDTELGEMYLIEIARGCGWGCRFCLAGYSFRPMRARSLESLLSQARVGLKFRKRLGLVGAAVSDHPQIEDLMESLRCMGAELSVSSLRIRPLSRVVLRALAEGATRSIALAPEAGSERLRRVINKGIAEEDILKAVAEVARQGLRQLKLYFMVGLPTETDDDIDEIVKLTLACKELLDRQQTGSQMTINITPFVPKASTPFQWLPMATPDVLSCRLSSIRAALRPKGIKVKSESVGWSVVQGVLARGDSRLAAVLAGMSENYLSAWRRAMEECDLNPDSYAHRRLSLDETLPWSALNLGVTPDYLRAELEKAWQGAKTLPCPPSECHECGVC